MFHDNFGFVRYLASSVQEFLQQQLAICVHKPGETEADVPVDDVRGLRMNEDRVYEFDAKSVMDKMEAKM